MSNPSDPQDTPPPPADADVVPASLRWAGVLTAAEGALGLIVAVVLLH